MDPAALLAQLPADQREALQQATYADFHKVLVEANKTGDFTILDFFDVLPWLQGPGDWTPWRAFVAAVFGLPMTEAELAIYRKCTGRKNAPTQQVDEAWMPVGRRGRKSACAAVIASYVGAFWDHSEYTAQGERALIPVLAKSKGDAQTIKRYVDAIFEMPQLAHLVQNSSTECVSLTTGVDIEIKAATITAGRGRAIPLWILDEVAFFAASGPPRPRSRIRWGWPYQARTRSAASCGATTGPTSAKRDPPSWSGRPTPSRCTLAIRRSRPTSRRRPPRTRYRPRPSTALTSATTCRFSCLRIWWWPPRSRAGSCSSRCRASSTLGSWTPAGGAPTP